MFFKKFVACALICGLMTGVLGRMTFEDDSDFGAEGSGHGESPSTETSQSSSTTSSNEIVEIFSSQETEKQPIIRLISMPNSINFFLEGTEFKAQCLIRSKVPRWILGKPEDQIKDLHIHTRSIYKDEKFYAMQEIQFRITREHDKLELTCSGVGFPFLTAKFVIRVDYKALEDSGIQKDIVIDYVPDDVKDPGSQANSSSCDSDGDSEAGTILGMQVAIGVLVLTVLVLVVLLFVVSRATGRLSIGGSKPSETNDNEQNSSAKCLRISSS